MDSSENAIRKLRKLKAVMTRKLNLWNLPARIEIRRSLEFLLRSYPSSWKERGLLSELSDQQGIYGKIDIMSLPINMTLSGKMTVMMFITYSGLSSLLVCNK